jgi:NTP pyrophosphatase (non-canonical NTP hydrolase)
MKLPTSLNEFSNFCHNAMKKWWQDPHSGIGIERNKGELIALMHSELSEALEGARKSKGCECICGSKRTYPVELQDGGQWLWKCICCGEGFDGPPLSEVAVMDDKLPHRDTLTVELADCLIRIFDYAGAHGLDLQGAFEEKMAFNAVRKDHTHEARREAGGKNF